jgi:tetratricopeptide (TPR) repeat protein
MALTPLQANGAIRSDGGCLDAELLASYVDGRTTPEERIKVEAHIAHCEDCYFLFSETVQEQQARSANELTGDEVPQNRWRRWMPRVAAGLAAAAALVIAAQISRPLWREGPKDNLVVALSELDAATGPYRRVEPRLTAIPTYRELEPALRSGTPSAEAPLALREAALKVELAARASGTNPEAQQALAAMYLTLGRPQRAAEVLAPLASSRDAGQLNDLAAAYLARRADDDVTRALDLLEQAVSLDPGRAEVWFNLGLAAEAAGQRERAIEAWTRALALDPKSGWANEAREHLARLKQRVGLLGPQRGVSRDATSIRYGALTWNLFWDRNEHPEALVSRGNSSTRHAGRARFACNRLCVDPPPREEPSRPGGSQNPV